MANPNVTFGFRPIRSLNGGEIRVNYYRLISNATRVGKGDLMVLDSAGNVKRATSTLSTGPWIGVAAKDSGTVTTAIDAFPLYDDPACLFETAAWSSAALATTDLNNCYKVSTSATLDTNTGLSKNRMKKLTCSTSVGVRLLRVISDGQLGIADSGTSVRVEVMLNNHVLRGGTAAV